MSDLTAKQKAAIVALLDGHTQATAAAAAGVARQTVAKWLNDPTFSATLRAGGDGAIRAASARLAALAEHAIEAIAATMEHPTTPGAAVRLRAADALLGQSLKIREHADILDRLDTLEARLNEQNQ